MNSETKHTLSRLRVLRQQVEAAIAAFEHGQLRHMDSRLNGPNRIGDFLITDTKAHEAPQRRD